MQNLAKGHCREKHVYQRKWVKQPRQVLFCFTDYTHNEVQTLVFWWYTSKLNFWICYFLNDSSQTPWFTQQFVIEFLAYNFLISISLPHDPLPHTMFPFPHGLLSPHSILPTSPHLASLKDTFFCYSILQLCSYGTYQVELRSDPRCAQGPNLMCALDRIRVSIVQVKHLLIILYLWAL